MIERWRKIRDLKRRLHPCPECGKRAYAGWKSADGSYGGNFCVRCEYGTRPY